MASNPAKLARALVSIASQDPPPRRFIAAADAIATAEQVLADWLCNARSVVVLRLSGNGLIECRRIGTDNR